MLILYSFYTTPQKMHQVPPIGGGHPNMASGDYRDIFHLLGPLVKHIFHFHLFTGWAALVFSILHSYLSFIGLIFLFIHTGGHFIITVTGTILVLIAVWLIGFFTRHADPHTKSTVIHLDDQL